MRQAGQIILLGVCLLFSFQSLFSFCSNQPGICFTGKGARIVLMDASSKINLRSNANKGWEEFSIVKNCGSGLAADLRQYDDTPCDLMVNNSEAIVADHDLTVDNSNVINDFYGPLVIENSDAIEWDYHFKVANSWAIVNNRSDIDDHETRIDHIETLTQTIEDNSNVIKDFYGPLVIENSDAIDYWAEVTNANSEWIVNFTVADFALPDWVKETSDRSVANSNAINFYGPLVLENSAAIDNLADCCVQISEQVYANSDAIEWDYHFKVANSDAIDYWADRIVENSYAIDATWNLALYNSEAIVANSLDLIYQNSLAINANRAEINANSTSIVNNSYAIVANLGAILNNSAAIAEMQDEIILVTQNSDAIADFYGPLVLNNSAAIDNLADCCVQISDQVYANSDAIVALADQLGTVNQDDINILYSYVGSIDHGPGDIYFDTNQTMSYNIYLGPQHKMFLEGDMTLNGSTWYIHFSRADEPLLFIDPGKTVTLRDVVLKDFSPDLVSFGDSDSKLIFGGGTTLELAENVSLTQEWTFTGDCTIKGFDKTITLGTGARLDVYGGGTLRLEDVELCGVGAENLRCRTTDGVIVLQDSKIGLASDYTFSYGAMIFKQEVKITGTNTFAYSTEQTSTIDSCATLFVDFGATFHYAPPIANRDLLYMTDTSSRLHLNGCTLSSTPTGFRATRGMVLFDNFVTLSAQGQVSSEAISFGKTDDPSGTNDVMVGVLGGAYVEAYGYIDMK